MPFRDVIGHRRIVALLSRSIRRHSLPPSLILSGPSGVGKRLVAIATAQTLNCLAVTSGDFDTAENEGVSRGEPGDPGNPGNPGNPDACGTCAACLRIARGIHPDVLTVEPGENGSIKIEQVRDLIDRAAYRPFEGRRRVVIIDDADALVSAAQNALLKTLEEPPPSSSFMLVTAHPDMLLPTVRSRCPQLRFRPLPADEVAAALIRSGRPEEEARAVAGSADGSIGRALEACAGDRVEARDAAMRVLVQAAATDEPRRRIDGARDLLARTGSGGAADRDQVASHLHAMGSLLRDIEVLGTGAEPHTPLANADVRPALERLAVFRGERGVRAFDAVGRALDALGRNAGVKVVADWLVLRL